MNKFSVKNQHKYERGQAIILVAFGIVGLVAMLGLVADTGLLLIEYANLKRGVDAGSVAAAQEYSLPIAQLTPQAFTDAATNFINLNQTKGITSIVVHSCLAADLNPPDLCNKFPLTKPEDNRKLVEVTASAEVQFYFLSVVGIKSTTITASAVGEAATMDIVLVIDTSASMAYETRPDPDIADNGDGSNLFRYDPYIAGMVSENPEDCNDPLTSNPCEPMKSVKDAALSFIQTLNFDYDRVGIVALTGQETDGTAKRHPVQVLPLSSSKTAVQNAITDLKVFQPHRCDDTLTASSPEFNEPNDPGVCILFVDGQFSSVIPQSMQLQFPFPYPTGDYNYAPHPSSNVGGALRLAAATLAGSNMRLDSYWVSLVLLTSGATSTDTPENYPDTLYADGVPAAFPYGYCPESTYKPSNGVLGQVYPYKFCTDGRPSVRHTFSQTASFTFNSVTKTISVYDPDDYARDRADNLANLLSGTGVTIYTIGLGVEVTNTSNVASGEEPLAQELLKYIAETAGRSTIRHGQYFPAPNSSTLELIFQKIAANIATKISQ